MTALEAAAQFELQGAIRSCALYGNGHINQTYLLRTEAQDYILQRINKLVFTRPAMLMENIAGVTAFLAQKIAEAGGDPRRECLNLVPSKSGDACYCDPEGEYWRIYHFITDSLSLERIEQAEDFYESGTAFGRFAALLKDYPAEKLHETIPDFHHTPKRFEQFEAAYLENAAQRRVLVEEEVAFLRERQAFMAYLTSRIASGELPLAVTHNDTKLNNVLFDKKTRRALCVLDLDTIMPGLSAYDFGDSIRFGASTAAEDEQDLDRVQFDINLFDSYLQGYLAGRGAMTQAELDALPYGAMMMTLECGMRFLTDYLNGDVYFRIHRKDHNLDRCRTQLKLVQEMEQQLPQMQELVRQRSGRE